MRLLILGGKLQGMEAVYLAQKAGWTAIVADRTREVPAADLADAFVCVDLTDENAALPIFRQADAVLPAMENRDGARTVMSRCGLKTECVYMEELPGMDLSPYACIIIDEAQFLSKDQVAFLVHVVDDLNNAIWNWQIPEEMNRPSGPRPMLIVNDHGQCGGFAGPIVVEPDGRCWILGVAVHSRYRGHGAATILFNRMCQAFKEAGAKYLTLFTDEKNLARNIFESAGMKIVYSWADMRRVHP